ncbi:MAG: 16S rRNA processing protein RimM [Dehalococcoidia bacterium]|nr:16S rRNA processing protein RimM [Dehalococcoidia bacterium]
MPDADAGKGDVPTSGDPAADAPLPDATAPGRIAVGRIDGVWGMKGHVKVRPLSTNPDRLKADAVVLVLGRPTKILEVVTPQGYPIVRFQGYPDRTAAERLRDTVIEIDEADLPPLPEGEYYIDDLVGLDVVTTDGEPVGRLTEVLGTGANDVYVVARPGLRDALIPAINDVVVSVDLQAKRMVINVIPGLLD